MNMTQPVTEPWVLKDAERAELLSVLQRHGCYGGEWFSLVEDIRRVLLLHARLSQAATEDEQ